MHPLFHSLQRAMRRHHHHQQAGARGPRGFSGFGGDGRRGDPWQPGPGGLHRGRKLGSADLQLLLLALLAERASHGYELMKALDERSHGYYSPSPGMVYPALTYLEEVGHASVETQGTKKLYSVTADGQAHLDAQRPAVDALLRQLAWIGSRMDGLRQAMASQNDGAGNLDAAAGGGGRAADFDAPPVFRGRGRGQHGAGVAELHAARHSLKAALAEAAGAAVPEQQRIARILQSAAAAIRSGATGDADAGAAGDADASRPSGSGA